MLVNMLTLEDSGYPVSLRNIPGPPSRLYYVGTEPGQWTKHPRVAIVGSRKASAYGRYVTAKLASELVSAGVVIISGLAFGIDSVAHRAALDASGITVAVLPTGLDAVYPTAHQNLARQIIESGGTLISEYPAQTIPFRGNFIARNRIVSGLADVLVITEAAINSGSLHTARFALEQGKTVMSVPGNINSPLSEGCNNLIKSGAVAITNTSDIFFALGLSIQPSTKPKAFSGSQPEQNVLNLIAEGVSAQEEIAIRLGLDGSSVGSSLTMLEISGRIRPLGGGYWSLT